MKKRNFKAIGLVLLMMISIMTLFAGCSLADAKAEKDYYDQVTKVAKNITDSATKMKSTISEMDITNDSTMKAAVESITAVEKDFKELQGLKAPKKYEEVQKDFSSACDKALQALSIYKTEIGKLNAKTTEAELDAATKKLLEGDKYMEDAVDILQKASDKADKLDGITTKSSNS